MTQLGRTGKLGRIIVIIAVACWWLSSPTTSFVLTWRRPYYGSIQNQYDSVSRFLSRARSSMAMNQRNDHDDDAPSKTLPSENDGDTVPANLTRKIRAKRPTLGHVVPKAARQKGAGGSSNPRVRPQGKAREAGLNNPSNLKILSGTARGRRLDSPDVYLRPMMGKVRGAVFSTLTSFGLYVVDSAKHLDIFAGSGSVGLESLSRGAAFCTFVDLSRDCCDAIERNIKWCQFQGQGDVKCADAIQALTDPQSVGIPPGTTYQIVTICPPYEEVVYAELLDAVANSPLVTDDTVILVEYPVELGCFPHVLTRRDGGKLIGIRNRKYGRTVIAMYIVNPTGRMEVADSRPEEFVSV